MKKFVKGFFYENSIKESLVERYYEYFLKIPEQWQQKFMKYGWAITIVENVNVDNLDEKEMCYISNVLFEKQLKEIKIVKSKDELEQKCAIYDAFAGFIRYQFEKYENTLTYLELYEEHQNEITKMQCMVEDKCNQLISLLMYFYLEEGYGKQYFEENNIMDVYEYIDEWMTSKVFQTPDMTEYVTPVYIGRDVTKISAEMLNAALTMVPAPIIEEIEENGNVFFAINDEYYKEINSLRDEEGMFDSGKRRFYIKAYSNIGKEVMYVIGLYLFDENCLRSNKTAQEVYMEERNEESRARDSMDFYGDEKEKYYGQMFSKYFENKKELKENNPKTYEIIDSVVKKYTDDKVHN